MARYEVDGSCAKCGRKMQKKQMLTVFVKKWPNRMKTVGHVCENCLPELLDYLAVPDSERR